MLDFASELAELRRGTGAGGIKAAAAGEHEPTRQAESRKAA